jgi:hypothetical protein
MVDERRKLEQTLNEIQAQMKELEIAYEQYFAGVEKREPQKIRAQVEQRLRHLSHQPIFRTATKFRYQQLATRFQSYKQHWDRILRLMDEGKYHRHLAAANPGLKPTAHENLARENEFASNSKAQPNEADRLLNQLVEARKACGLAGPALTREKIDQFLATQRQKVVEKFGDRPVEFQVDISSGKPQIKVRLKKEGSHAQVS